MLIYHKDIYKPLNKQPRLSNADDDCANDRDLAGKGVFMYPKGVHNVHKVNGTGFQQCAAPFDSVPLTSGNDVVTLATPGENGTFEVLVSIVKRGTRSFL
ncbi:hypothetical protein TB2_031767 [Malus domestica]